MAARDGGTRAFTYVAVEVSPRWPKLGSCLRDDHIPRRLEEWRMRTREKGGPLPFGESTHDEKWITISQVRRSHKREEMDDREEEKYEPIFVQLVTNG
jgi:hypothetical protein